MRTSRHSVSLGTFGLAFAIVLSPSLMQTEQLTCAKTGDPTLATLELLIIHDGSEEDYIVGFDPEQLSYDVQTALCGWWEDCHEPGEQDGLTPFFLRAYSTDPEAEVMFNYSSEVWGVIDHDRALGGGEWHGGPTVEGESRLLVSVKAPGGATYSYRVNMSIDCARVSECGWGGPR